MIIEVMRKYILSVLSAAFLLTSCLDETNYTYIEKEDYIDSAQSARNVLYGVYRDMCSHDLYGHKLSICYDLPTDISKHDGTSLANNRDFANNAHTSTHAWVQNTWKALYNTIYDANDFIERVKASYENIPEEERATVDVYMAEARVIRALMHFELVRHWGNIIMMTSTEQSRQHPSTYVQDKPEDVYGFIEKELIESAAILPWAKADVIRPSNAFMISKGSALALLARVYVTWAGYPLMNTEKWTSAKNTCETIINSGMHDLLPDYEQLWRNACNSVWDPTESLFEISFYSPSISSSSASNCSGYIGKWNGVHVEENTTPLVRVDARYRAVPTFAANWPNPLQDKRFSLSLADHYYEGTQLLGRQVFNNAGVETVRWYTESDIDGVRKVYRDSQGDMVTFLKTLENPYTLGYKWPYREGLYVAKWDLTKYVDASNQLSDGNQSNANWYILRYSDVLLMYAEAINEISGPTTEAYAAVNKVRRRGYGYDMSSETPTDADLPAGLSQDDFRESLRNERAYELCFEGQRKQDLIRWGIYVDSIKGLESSMNEWCDGSSSYILSIGYTTEGKHELQPIPQRELDLMTGFEQNPKWGK